LSIIYLDKLSKLLYLPLLP